MGVTLERVQNKFACIIGELCNEPYVLSQFAIWVDLRIAEYKANGAISLDCTGDNPHPTWLKGMNPPKSPIPNRSVNQSGRRHGIYESSGNPTSANESCELSFDSGEFEIIEVKEEPPDFPSCTSFKSHGRLSPTRKRTSESQDFLQSDNSIFPTSPPKSRKLSTASDNNELSGVGQDTVSHQSFMSVIGLADHSAHSVDNLNPSSGEKSQFSNFDQSKGSNSGNIPFEDVAVHPSISTDEDTMTHSDRQTMATPRFPGMQVFKFPRGMHSQSSKGSSRYPGRQPVSSMSETTAINTQSAVSIFERWLILNHPEVVNKFKCMEDLPSADLDEYLSQFWPSIKKQNGADYQVQSLIQLRTRLDRHLRRKGYPLSIVKSEAFAKSQKALKERTTIFPRNPTYFTPVVRSAVPPLSHGAGITCLTPLQDVGVDLSNPFVPKTDTDPSD